MKYFLSFSKYAEDVSLWVYACVYMRVCMGVIKYLQKYMHLHNIPVGTKLRRGFLESQEFPTSIFYIHTSSKRNEKWTCAGENTFHFTVLTPLY